MKRILIAATMFFVALPAVAQLYKWVDKDGKTIYSDTPPPNQDSKQLSVGTGTTSAPAAPAKSAVARDKELEKGRQESREAEKKANDAANLQATRDENCRRMRVQYQTFVDGGRLIKYNDKGEREMLDDDQIAAEKEKVRVGMEDACKKP
ncbi:hypothetical protein BWI17_20055 [Betaproteobacteria bacterium GR16-43]|nr:hypothetical protein BWI17_20055 [Betaproteobacteria bacterium GR16-43]